MLSEPKSGWRDSPANPAAEVIAGESGSTGADAILVFQALSAGKGTNPFRFAPLPSDMPAQVWAEAGPAATASKSAIVPSTLSLNQPVAASAMAEAVESEPPRRLELVIAQDIPGTERTIAFGIGLLELRARIRPSLGKPGRGDMNALMVRYRMEYPKVNVLIRLPRNYSFPREAERNSIREATPNALDSRQIAPASRAGRRTISGR